jgi:hypothetical protein
MVAMTDAAQRHTEELPDCEFCQGTEAHDAGLPGSANPYPGPPAHLRQRTVGWYETSWALWDTAGSSRTSRTRPRAAAETGVDRRPVSDPQRRRGRRGECDASARWPSPPARNHARRGHDPAACAACTSGSRASSCGANEPSCCSRSSLPPGWARWLRMRRAHGSQCRTIRLRFFGGVRCSPR